MHGTSLFKITLGLSLYALLLPSSASALTIELDFSHDTTGLFSASNPQATTARAAVAAAAADISAAISSPLSEVSTGTTPSADAISSTSGSSTVTISHNAYYANPNTGEITLIESLAPGGAAANDTATIFVGSRNLSTRAIARGGPGPSGFAANISGPPGVDYNTAAALANSSASTYLGRGGGPIIHTSDYTPAPPYDTSTISVSFGLMVGQIYFDTDTNNSGTTSSSTDWNDYWHFDHTTPPASSKVDLYTVALHEFLHALGIGSSESWDDNIDVATGTWRGSAATALNQNIQPPLEQNSTVTPPLSADDFSHIATGVKGTIFYPTSGVSGALGGISQGVVTNAESLTGKREFLTTMDLALLEDIGWSIAPLPEPNPVLNLSTRGRVGTGDNVLIGGFIIQGSGTKQLLITGRGPSIPSSVSGRLADPKVDIYDASGTVIASNNNWASGPQAAAISATSVGGPASLADAAVLLNLGPGAYTAIVRGSGATEGIGIVEIYDLAPGGTAFLKNLSTRGAVGTGDDVLICGMVIGGGSDAIPAPVVIRGRGPSIPASVPGRLADPTVQLFNGATPVVTVDDWASSAFLSGGSHFHLQPGSSFDSAFLRSYTSGAHTAILRGYGGGTGIGIVELFIGE